MFYAGKRKARFTRTGYVAGRRNAFKKAVITLREGDTIDFYSNI
jgi:large subunit ribosomal protein L23